MIIWAYDNFNFNLGQYILDTNNENAINSYTNYKFRGYGLSISVGKFIYAGNFKDNKANGEGRCFYNDGSSY